MATTPAALPDFDDRTVFRTLFAAYPDALLLVDAKGSIVLANPEAESLLGYGKHELIGLPVDALVPDSIRPRHAAYRDAYARNPRQRPMGTQMELVAKRRDGSEVMVEIALSPLQEHGLPYTVAAIRGIGAYPRVRQALQRALYAEQVVQFGRLAVDARDPQQLVDAAPKIAAEALKADVAVVLLLAPNGVEFRVTSAVGLPPEHAVGQLVTDAEVYLQAGFASALTAPLSDRGRTIGALAVRWREPQRFGDDEVRFLDSLSSLLTTSLQRAQSEEALKHSQRLESVGQLTGGIAHDFNNLLTVISGNLQVLEELPAIADDAFGQQLVGAAMRAGKRGAELTGKLLAFSRRQVLQPTRVDVAALLGSLTDMLRRTLDQRIEIKLDVAPDCPPCLADPGQLESALLNVAINARDAMPEGGTLAFACRQVPLWPELKAELGDASDDAYASISISDTGRGMPDSVKERAFEPFFTTKEAGRGTGLGLSTVYGFAKQSRGAVTLDSTLGVGTTVTLYLPRVADAAAADDAEAEQAGNVPAGLRVLMVEDDAEVRSVVHKFLLALGCVVTSCVNAEEAMATLESVGPFDLLLTDIALGPGMRGTDLALRAQQQHPELPVLLMSGFASGLLATPPGWELLRKPYTREDLARAIAKVLGRA
jgi:PAS domain S-box-containing protein